MRLGTPAERAPMDDSRVEYEFAVLRVVPHVHLGAFVNVGVVVHGRRRGYLALRTLDDVAHLRTRLPDMDIDLLARYLRSCVAICAGDAAAGPVALAPTSERFHWITAPRSDVLQSSPVHEGVCDDASREIARLFDLYVGADRAGVPGSSLSSLIPIQERRS